MCKHLLADLRLAALGAVRLGSHFAVRPTKVPAQPATLHRLFVHARAM